MSFYESPRFPDYLAYGLLVGPAFNTDVVRVKSGAESRNQLWEQELHEFDGTTTARTAAERLEITSFFRTMKGRTHGFRIKDWSDYQDEGAGVLTLLGSPANTYQLAKRYTSGNQTYDRPITKPVSGTVAIQGGGTYSLDTTTGIVTHTAGNAPTGWTGEFDVPARFDQDDLKWEVQGSGSGRLYLANSLKIVELRIET